MPALRPSTWVIVGLLLVLAWQTRHLLMPAASTAIPWVLGQPAALLVLLLCAIAWRATHPTAQVRTR
jgi:hypothetical protein